MHSDGLYVDVKENRRRSVYNENVVNSNRYKHARRTSKVSSTPATLIQPMKYAQTHKF